MDRRQAIVVRFHSNMLDVIDTLSRKRYTCTLRGKFKQQGIRPIVGDIVEYIGFDDMKGRIENILPRKNELNRPRIANIDQVILVLTISHPPISLITLDKFLIMAELQEIESVLVFNKLDLLDSKAKINQDKLMAYYSKYHTCIQTSAKTAQGIDLLKRVFNGKISTMAGMSGVGKSSLLNAIEPGLKLREGDLSQQLVRGKHTTTYTELLGIGETGLIADTPGFAFLDLKDFDSENIRFLMPDLIDYSSMCSFENCSHIAEPGCAVKEAVEEGKILMSRYENYLKILDEIDNQ
ncbi:MAG TPA: ribosome small subunit-dependent GTPase A [Thermotogota bacterium]|nr:ribosome small subunit-dependent GTPase A [Thermotogota bacterium]HRW34275.1 ribosome small subunit-dependent GTPase A [Thermotogota bacterium]